MGGSNPTGLPLKMSHQVEPCTKWLRVKSGEKEKEEIWAAYDLNRVELSDDDVVTSKRLGKYYLKSDCYRGNIEKLPTKSGTKRYMNNAVRLCPDGEWYPKEFHHSLPEKGKSAI